MKIHLLSTGYSNEQIHELSQKIIAEKDISFEKAYDADPMNTLGYSNKKQSLRKFECDLGIVHKESKSPFTR